MLIIGIDPGFQGGIAVLDTASGAASVYNIPILKRKIDGKYCREYVRKEMLKLLKNISRKVRKNNILVIIEQQRIYGCEGRKSAFSLGLGYGHLLMAIDACKLPYVIVKVSDWKRAMSLTSDKEFSRQKAKELFPGLVHDLRFKKSHGLAEAALLADYGQKFLLPQTIITNNKYLQKEKKSLNLYEVKDAQVTDLCNTAIQH